MQAGEAGAPQRDGAAGARRGPKKGRLFLVDSEWSPSGESRGVGEEKDPGSELC